MSKIMPGDGISLGTGLWLLHALCSLGLVVARGRIQAHYLAPPPSCSLPTKCSIGRGSPVQSLDLHAELSQLAWGCPGDKEEQIWTN